MKVTYKNLDGENKTLECEASSNAIVAMRFKEVELTTRELNQILNERKRGWLETALMNRFENYPITIKISANETN
jgi:hypothetical protein